MIFCWTFNNYNTLLLINYIINTLLLINYIINTVLLINYIINTLLLINYIINTLLLINYIISQIASYMTSANKRWTKFGRRWSMNADENSYLFLLIMFYHSFYHINNVIIICDRIKTNCHHSFIRNPMMCVKDRRYIFNALPPPFTI